MFACDGGRDHVLPPVSPNPRVPPCPVSVYLLSCPRVPTAPVTPDMKPKMVGRAGAVWGPLIREAGLPPWEGGALVKGATDGHCGSVQAPASQHGKDGPSRRCTGKVLECTREAKLGWNEEGSVLFKCSIASGPGPFRCPVHLLGEPLHSWTQSHNPVSLPHTQYLSQGPRHRT